MARAKRGAKSAPKTFPKDQGVEGEGDRFVPPDRIDQREDPEDRAQTIQFKDVSADIEVIERRDDDDGRESAGDGEEDDDDEADQRQTRRRSADDDDDDPVQNGRRLSQESRSVRARVNRERVLREQAEAKVANAERRARSVEERLAKLERVTTEVQENTSVKALEAKIAALEAEVKKALAEDDHKLAFEKQADLGDAKADLKLMKRDLEAARRQQIAEEEARKQSGAGAEAAADTGESPGTVDWKHANRGWWNRARYKDAKEDAIGIDADILGEINNGDHDFVKYSDEHFELLNARLAELYPDLPLYHTDGRAFEDDQQQEPDVNDRRNDRGARDRDGQRAPQNTRNRAPVSGRGTRQQNGRRVQSEADLAREGKVTLSKEDFGQMRLYGLDPKNNEHKKRFAKERMRSILTEDRRSARS